MSSFAMKIMKTMMRLQPGFRSLGKSDTVDWVKFRAMSDRSMEALKPAKGVSFRSVRLGSMDGEVCTPASVRNSAVIFYIHGGGFVAGNAKTSRAYASAIAAKTGFPVYTCTYRLAPEHPAPAMQEDCLSGYEALLALYPDTPIVLLGESGGAHLALTTALLAKEKGLRLPACVAAYSVPLAWDGSLNEQRAKNEKSDIQLSVMALDCLADSFCPDAAKRMDWLISPRYADYAGFPPLYLSWAENEVLAADSKLLEQLAKQASVNVVTHPMPDAFHAFVTLAGMLPEADEILQETKQFIENNL